MLHRGSKYLLGFITVCLLSNCLNKNKEKSDREELYRQFSEKVVGKLQYKLLYKRAEDSIKFYVENKLYNYNMERYSQWQLDSMICFDKKGKKCVMAILNRESADVNNSIYIFYGAKINGQWYYYSGATLVATPYSHTPLTFAQLHDIAMNNIFRGYLTRKTIFNDWEINDRFFDEMEEKSLNGTYGDYPGFKTFEEGVLDQVGKNWKEKRK